MAKVVTNKVRFSYAHVFEPVAMKEGQEKKYSTAILIPKKDKKGIAEIEAAIETGKKEWEEKFGGKLPKNWHNPLRDGDEEKEDDPVYAGHMFLSAKSTRKPQLVDEDLNPIMDRDEFYSGCYGRASLNFFPFKVPGNHGIGVGLNNLQKLEDGERLGGGPASAEDDFGGLD